MTSISREPPPVDRGWAWVILAIHSISTMIMSLKYASGIFNVTFLEVYNLSKGETAWCGSIHIGMYYFAGIPAGMMTDYLGARFTIIIGGLITTLGLVLGYFSTSFLYTCITYGFIAGTGYGIVYVPCLATVGVYFDKHRTLAYGVLTMGTGFGWLILSPAVEYICSEYGWRTAMIFIAGVSLHLVIIGALTRPLDLQKQSTKEDTNEKGDDGTQLNHTDQMDDQIVASLSDSQIQSSEDKHLNGNLIISNKMEYANSQDEIGLLKTKNPQSEYSRSQDLKIIHEVGKDNRTSSFDPVISMGPSVTENVSHDIPDLCQKRINENVHHTDPKNICTKYKPLLKGSYIIFLVNILCLYASQAMFYIHFPAFVRSMGTSSSELSIIFSCMGAATITSRFSTGLFASKCKIDVCVLYIISCIVTGIILIFGPLMGVTYTGQIALGVCFALCTNVTIPLAVPILIRLLGVELVNMSTGVHIFMGGFGFMFAPPLAGLLYDISGSYQTTFYSAGAIMIFGGVVMIPLIFNRQHH